MYSVELGSPHCRFYVYWTQKKNLLQEEESALLFLLDICADIFEKFVTTPEGRELLGGGERALEFSLTVCGEKKIHSLNQKYRSRAKKPMSSLFPYTTIGKRAHRWGPTSST